MRTRWLAAVAGLTFLTGGVADAADTQTPVYKVPPPVRSAPAYTWTGCYVGAGAGYGHYSQETSLVTVRAQPGIPNGTTFVDGLTQGGRGWLATAQVGCDYQLASSFVAGAFVDADWANIKGRHTGGDINIGLQQGEERLRRSWAVGGRVGWLPTPQLLTFVSAGYTQASFSDVTYDFTVFPVIGTPTGLQLPGRTYGGWFIGGGAEYAIGWLPGLFWKTEYRFADYGTHTDTVLCVSAPLCGVAGPTAFAERNHPYTHTMRTQLVWRFSWEGPVVAAKY